MMSYLVKGQSGAPEGFYRLQRASYVEVAARSPQPHPEPMGRGCRKGGPQQPFFRVVVFARIYSA